MSKKARAPRGKTFRDTSGDGLRIILDYDGRDRPGVFFGTTVPLFFRSKEAREIAQRIIAICDYNEQEQT